MKKNLLLVAMLCMFATVSNAQFKSQQSSPYSNGMYGAGSSNTLFNWIDMNKFSMQHSFSMNYMNVGGQNLSINSYTNTMRYAFTDGLSARADVSMMYSPTGVSFGRNQSQLSNVFLNRAQIDYSPWDNVHFQIQYRNNPFGYYNDYYSNPFRSSFSRFGDE